MGKNRDIARRALRIACVAVSLAGAAGARAGDADVAVDADAKIIARLREASALRDEGEYGDAADKLEKLEEGDLGAAVGLIRARLLRADGEVDDAAHAAEAAVGRVPAADEVRAHLYAELASIYLERGDLTSAHEAQHAASDATRSSEYAATLASELAAAYESQGKPAEALTLYTRVWQRYPLSSSADRAFARAAALAASTGAPPPEPTALLARADRLRQGFRCDAALPIYESLLSRADTSPVQKPGLERGRAECLFMARRYPEAVEAFGKLAAADPNDFEASFQQARALARSGEHERALESLTKLTKTEDAVQRARVRALLAVILEDRDPARARVQLRQLERQTAAPNLASEARWSLAWADMRAGAGPKALVLLDKLAQGPSEDIEVQRARYWRGVVRSDSQDEVAKAEGAAQLQALAAELPLSYYGMLAAQRVGEQPVEKSLAGLRVPEPEPAALRRTRLLLGGGFPEVASDEIQSYADGARLTREGRIATARLLHETGDSYRALKLIEDAFGPTLEQGVDPAWRDAWELAWPRAFGQWVGGVTREFSFDPALVWAIMREESNYRAQVSSPAGALGLMQLMPPTASRVASQLGMNGFVTERLYDPETNIRLGTWYLRSLYERFGSRPLAIASYNAGPEAVGRWLAKDSDSPPDEFVESVSYGETRRYLRRVLRSYRVYQLLYGDEVKPAPAPAAVAPPPAEGEPAPQQESDPGR